MCADSSGDRVAPRPGRDTRDKKEKEEEEKRKKKFSV